MADRPEADGEVTELLRRLPTEREVVEDQLLALLGGQLHAVASRLMARENAGHTLQPTALVNDAWMRMADQRVEGWENREQFVRLAAQAMRRLLINHARDRRALKRSGGGAGERVAVESILAYYEERHLDVLVLDEALARLAEEDEAGARIVELRFFAGLTLPEAADTMGASLRTAERAWTRARRWLETELAPDDDEERGL